MTNNLFHIGFYAMGTRFEAILCGINHKTAQRVEASVKKKILSLHQRLNRFDKASVISRINHNAGIRTVKTPAEIFQLLMACISISQQTGGLVDITIKPLLDQWQVIHGQRKNNKKPPERALKNAKKKTGCSFITFNHKQMRIGLPAGHGIDLGAVAKGYALDVIKKILTRERIKNAFISFGESSVLAMGNHPAGTGWPVQITAPENSNRVLKTILLQNTFMSVSGNRINNRQEGHIIHPATGMIANNKIIAVAVAPSGLLADALSTALFLDARIKTIFKNQNQIILYRLNPLNKLYV